MDEIKDFFQKLKLKQKFSKAGEGHCLKDGRNSAMGQDESKAKASGHRQQVGAAAQYGNSPQSASREVRNVQSPRPQTAQEQTQRDRAQDDARLRAADAALTRLAGIQAQKQKVSQLGQFRVCEARQPDMVSSERGVAGRSESAKVQPVSVSSPAPNSGTIAQIYYRCEALNLPRMARFELEDRVRADLYAMRSQEPLLASVLIIKSCNRFNKAVDPKSIDRAVELLARYVTNVIEHPTESKFRQIRAENRVFRESVLAVEGSAFFLEAVGFASRQLPRVQQSDAAANPQAGDTELFFVFDAEPDAQRVEQLREAREQLLNTPALELQLDRDLRVIRLRGSARELHVEFPPEFFSPSKEDLKVAQSDLEQAIADGQTFRMRGKAAQERQDAAMKTRLRENYPFTLMRFRFPNDLLIQGVFETSEPLQNAIDWLVSLLVVDWCPFELRNPQLNVTFLSESIDEADRRRSLLELNLAPTMLLNFSWSKELLEDMSKQMASQQKDNSNPLATLQCYLHPEYLAAAGPE